MKHRWPLKLWTVWVPDMQMTCLLVIPTIKPISAHWAGQLDRRPPLEPFPLLGIFSHVSLIKLSSTVLTWCSCFLILRCETTNVEAVTWLPEVSPSRGGLHLRMRATSRCGILLLCPLSMKPKVFLLSLDFRSVDHL